MPTPDNTIRDQRDLGRRFSLAEYHFRHPLTDRPVMVNPRKVEVFVGGVPHGPEDPGMGLRGWDRSLLEFGEKGVQFGVGHVCHSYAAGVPGGRLARAVGPAALTSPTCAA